MKKYNKYKMMEVVNLSRLAPANKAMLNELILRSDDSGFSWPSVQRLCMARGISHEKNFKGVTHYLPGLVTVSKRGRKNTYTLNIEAIMALPAQQVTLRHTPALGDAPSLAGHYDPSGDDNTPTQAATAPSEQGANSTSNNTKSNSSDSSLASDADASSTRAKEDELEGLKSFFAFQAFSNFPAGERPLSNQYKGSASADEGASSGLVSVAVGEW